MPILNYTTSVNAAKTMGQIQGMLVAHGAKAILTNYKDGILESLSFIVLTPDGEVPIRLPVDWRAVLKVLEKQRTPLRYRTKEHAVMVAWRIAKDWVEAQMAILEAEMVKLDQVFLPYVITRNDKTLYEVWTERKGYFLGQGKEE